MNGEITESVLTEGEVSIIPEQVTEIHELIEGEREMYQLLEKINGVEIKKTEPFFEKNLVDGRRLIVRTDSNTGSMVERFFIEITSKSREADRYTRVHEDGDLRLTLSSNASSTNPDEALTTKLEAYVPATLSSHKVCGMDGKPNPLVVWHQGKDPKAGMGILRHFKTLLGDEAAQAANKANPQLLVPSVSR